MFVCRTRYISPKWSYSFYSYDLSVFTDSGHGRPTIEPKTRKGDLIHEIFQLSLTQISLFHSMYYATVEHSPRVWVGMRHILYVLSHIVDQIYASLTTD